MQNAYPSILAQMAAMVEKHKQKHEKPNFMKATGITTYHTHVVDVETETTTFSATFAENDFGHDCIVIDVDNNEEIEKSDPQYNAIVKAAEDFVDAKTKPLDIEDLRRIESLSDPNKMRTPDMLFRELQLINIIAKQLIKNH